MFYVLVFAYYLSRRYNNLRLLDVVGVEVALEVEVREVVRIREAEQLLERGIRLDVVLVLQVLLLHVVVDLAGHVGAGDQSALGLAEEDAELLSDLRGDLEDGRTARLGALLTLDLDATATLARILDLAVHALLELFDLRDHRRDNLAETREASENNLEVIVERGRRHLSNRRGRLRGSGNYRHYSRYNYRRSRNRRLRGTRLSRRLLLCGNRRDRRNRRGDSRYNRRYNRLNLLRHTTLSSNNRDRAHRYTSTGGRIHLKQTHYAISRIQTAQFLFFFLENRP